MKEASGELNMTLITIVILGALLGLFMLFKDEILKAVKEKWNDNFGYVEVINRDYM